MSVVAGIFMIAGSALAMLGGIGVIRFDDVMSRMHAAAKTPTLGLMLVAIGGAIEIGTAAATATLALVVVLSLLTAPVAAHVLGRASHGKIDVVVDGEDALREYRDQHPRDD